MVENASLQLAAIPGIDAVVTGHQHRVWPSEDFAGDGIDLAAGTLNGKPATQGGFWGSHMGLIDLLLEQDGGTWRVAAAESSARPIYTAQRGPQHHAARRRLRPGHRGDRRRCTRRRWNTSAPRSAPPPRRCSPTSPWSPTTPRCRSSARRRPGTSPNSSRAPSGRACRSSPPPPPSSRAAAAARTTTPTSPPARSRSRTSPTSTSTPTRCRRWRSPAPQVKDWLERSAGIFNQVTAGAADQPLIDPAFPAYNFDIIDGVTYAIDVTQPSKYDVDGALAEPGRQPHHRSEVQRRSRLTRKRNSSSPPTTTAPAAAAASPAPTAPP